MPSVKVNLPTRKLGKHAPRLDRRTLKLAKYITPTLPPTPIRAGYIDKIGTWPMYLNDTLGDCVIAAAGHMIQQWTSYAGKPIEVSDHDIIRGYEKVGGYQPGDPTTDQGCDMLTALKYWRKTGIGGHQIKAFVAVDPKNRQEMEHAIYLFGNLFAGFALPLASQDPRSTEPKGTPCWEFPAGGLDGDGSPGSWGGHCIPLVGYSNDPDGNPGTMAVTWGTLYDVTWPFVRAYADEMYAVLSQDWFDATGKAPNGFNYAQLQADLLNIPSL